MIGGVGLGKFGEAALRPVKAAAVHNDAAHLNGMPVHIFGCGVHHDVRAEVEGAAEYGRGKGIVDDQRQAVAVRQGGHALDIQHVQRGIGQRFAEDGAGLGTDGLFDFGIGSRLIDEGHFDSHFFERDGKKIEGAAVDAGRADDVIAAAGNIENGQQVRRLPRCGAQGAHAAFELGNLAFHGIDGGIGQTGIEKAFVLQIEQARNGGSGFIGEGRALRYGQDAGFAVAGRIAAVKTKGLWFHGFLVRVAIL